MIAKREWTTETPTQHGAYFVKERGSDAPERIVEVEPSATGGLVWEFGKPSSRMLALFRGAEWWGPIVREEVDL